MNILIVIINHPMDATEKKSDTVNETERNFLIHITINKHNHNPHYTKSHAQVNNILPNVNMQAKIRILVKAFRVK